MDNETVTALRRMLTGAPKTYKAMTVEKEGEKSRVVTGYYVKHITETPPPINTLESHRKFIAEHTKHYIFKDEFADWALPRRLEQWEIKIETLEEVNDDPR